MSVIGTAKMSLYLKTDRLSRVSIFCKEGARLWEGKGTGERKQPHPMPINGCKKGGQT